MIIQGNARKVKEGNERLRKERMTGSAASLPCSGNDKWRFHVETTLSSNERTGAPRRFGTDHVHYNLIFWASRISWTGSEVASSSPSMPTFNSSSIVSSSTCTEKRNQCNNGDGLEFWQKWSEWSLKFEAILPVFSCFMRLNKLKRHDRKEYKGDKAIRTK